MADPGRPFSKQRSTITGEPRGPSHSPGHNRSASFSGGAINPANTSVRRSQNYAAKAAAARLAQVMASHSTDNDDDDDEFHNLPGQTATSALSLSAAGPRDASPTPRLPRRTPAIISESRDKSPLVGIRAAYSGYGNLGVSSVRTNSNLGGLHPTRSVPSGWGTSAHTNGSQRTRPTSLTPSLSKFTTTPRNSEPSPGIFRDVPLARDSRGNEGSIGSSGRREELALQDEIDVLHEENQQAVNQLRLVEERLQETEIRNKELERQIGSLGDGVSLEARLLSRKEAVLRQREAAHRAEKEQTTDVKDDEIAALRLEADTAKDEVLSATERSIAAEKEVQSLRSITRRMTLTKDEKQEMVLKRCWLARYWGLATRHGILPSVASSKQDQWSALAPLPLEVVTSAAHLNESNGHKGHKKAPSIRDLNEVIGDGNAEGMLAVEKGLRELASLKVEQSVMLSAAQHLHPSFGRSELTPEEVEDIRFKQAWLVYFWRRAKTFKVEADIADERLSYWISRSSLSPTSHDVVDVERGLLELHKLGVEEQLWETSRREVSRAAANHNSEVDEALT